MRPQILKGNHRCVKRRGCKEPVPIPSEPLDGYPGEKKDANSDINEVNDPEFCERSGKHKGMRCGSRWQEPC